MCVLHVTSESDSFTQFLRATGFPLYQSHEKGEISSIGTRRLYTDFGFSTDVSNREWTDLAGQIEDAYAFLRTHEEALRKLMATHCISDIRLDFPYCCRLGEQISVQCDYLPPALIRLAGDIGIGIELSHYPADNEESDSEQGSEGTAPR
jgi:hypothetical protein